MNDSSGMPFGDEPAQTKVVTFRVVVFRKRSGILCKKISLNPDDTVKSDGSACSMSVGTAELQQHNQQTFADLIGNLDYHEAIALGAFREGVPDQVKVETKRSAARTIFSGGRPDDLIVRSADYIQYLPGQPALLLIDVDTKAMPSTVREKIRAAGGFWPALVETLPVLAHVGRVTRPSTSTGLSRTDTGERLPGSEGLHIFIVAEDGADINRCLRALHDRLWLAGLGWMMVGRAGQFLSRSIADRMVGDGCRLVFESMALTVAPLVQDRASRKPIVMEGPALDTATCPDLTVVERDRLARLIAAEKQRLAPEAARAKAAFIDRQAARIVAKSGGVIDDKAARLIVERQTNGTLLPHVILTFDHLGEATVGEVLANPDKYVGQTLEDPLEGTAYGPCKAMIVRRADGTLWIHSFAHGETFYTLKHDARSIEAAILGAPEAQAADVLIAMIADAELNPIEDEHLKQIVYARAKGTKPKPLGAQIKNARMAAEKRRKAQAQLQLAALRTDRRVRLRCPSPTGERTPIMQQLNEVLGAIDALEPPMRDVEGHMVQVVVRRLPKQHLLTSDGANAEEAPEARMPAPEMPLLSRLSECELTELIERHIEFQTDDGAAVTLPSPFVKHFIQRQNDHALPFCSALATLPIVLPGAVLLAKRGLDRERGILFRIPEVLMAALPESHEQCDDAAILAAIKRLLDEWLVDVSADLIGKIALLAYALSIIERTQLSDRPVFFVTAARRGGGKTTGFVMVMVAITGIRPAASAWSSNEEERRKAMMAYLMEGLPSIIWDNIPRGARISCPHIEKACTAEFLSDRKLGVSENIIASAATIMAFTGNNIGPRGDTASRTLTSKITVNRPDPENRPFVHSDPIGWTKKHRHTILADIFTVLLGNPKLRTNYEPPTRFKDWMRLVGSALEHAAKLYRDDAIKHGADPASIPVVDFTELFLSQDDNDEQSSDLVSALQALSRRLPGEFTAAALADRLNDQSGQRSNEELADIAMLREFLYPDRVNFPNDVHTARSIGKRLQHHLGEPVPDPEHDGQCLTLVEVGRSSHKGDPVKYYVRASGASAGVNPGSTSSSSMPF
jgi:hypothetical protein